MTGNALRGLAVGLSGLLAAGCGDDRPPNVVLIVLDTVRVDALGGTFLDRTATPHLDQLMAESTVFDRAIATATWTIPAHASMFTGLYPRDHAATHGRFGLPDSANTLAERLLARGYVTCGLSNNPWINQANGMAQGFQDFHEVYRDGWQLRDKGGPVATELAVQWLETAIGEEKPFFLFINYMEAHLPYEPPAQFFLGTDLATPFSDVPLEMAEQFVIDPTTLDETELDHIRALYRAEVAFLDQLLPRLLSPLREHGVLEQTVVLITSDHGEHLGEHDLMGHEFTLYEEVLRVPLIIRFPSRFPPGRRVDGAVSQVDLLPTVLALAGDGPKDGSLPGRDLRRLTDPAPTREERPLFSQYTRPRKLIRSHWLERYPQADLDPFDRALDSVIQGRWKLIREGTGSVALYDLSSDPEERHNLSVEQGEKAAELERVLQAFRSGRR